MTFNLQSIEMFNPWSYQSQLVEHGAAPPKGQPAAF
jgi:hypothetical protein